MFILIDELGNKSFTEIITPYIDEQYVCGNIEHIINLSGMVSAYIDYPNLAWEPIEAYSKYK